MRFFRTTFPQDSARLAAPPFSRRQMLSQTSCGFGAVALAALLRDRAFGASPGVDHPATARHVIFLYMDGGPSHLDLFDPKPQLAKEHGQPFKMKVQKTQFNNVGNVLKCPWEFIRGGESGLPFGEVIPGIAAQADDICVIRSLTSKFSEHTNANYFLHSGHGLQGRPSMGSWVTYGLGSECQNLPGFVVLNGGLIPPGGLDCFHNGFLPATHQGSLFKAGAHPVADLDSKGLARERQLLQRALLRELDRESSRRYLQPPELEGAIANYEMAARMQTSIPDLVDISGESRVTQRLYGLDSDYEPTRIYGRNCLIARRLIERGVRFIELTSTGVAADRWDQHNSLDDGHRRNCRAVDQPIAGLLADLKARGLLDDTLVVFAGEFGRTPMAQGSDGRDHNPFGFSVWLAGGGVRGGTIYGATDEYGYYAVENKLEMHDLHATILHALGINHTRLTYRFGGRDMRLTDVFGNVVHDVLA